MGIAVLVIGVLGFFLSWIPVVGTIILKILALVGVILGCKSVASSDKSSSGLTIAGIILCGLVLMGNRITLF